MIYIYTYLLIFAHTRMNTMLFHRYIMNINIFWISEGFHYLQVILHHSIFVGRSFASWWEEYLLGLTTPENEARLHRGHVRSIGPAAIQGRGAEGTRHGWQEKIGNMMVIFGCVSDTFNQTIDHTFVASPYLGDSTLDIRTSRPCPLMAY